MAREGNNPKRRIGGLDRLTMDERKDLAAKVAYVGSGHHKRFPAVFGFGRSASPRPTKSVCDGIKAIPKGEAEQLLRTGVLKGMFSEPSERGFPTYVWCVDADGEVYEANTHPNNQGQYHGYRIEEHDPMRGYVLSIWKQRCRQTGQ
jgi:hypothetical protein